MVQLFTYLNIIQIWKSNSHRSKWQKKPLVSTQLCNVLNTIYISNTIKYSRSTFNPKLSYTVSHELLYLNSVLFSFLPHTFIPCPSPVLSPFLFCHLFPFPPPSSLLSHPLASSLLCPVLSSLSSPAPLSMVVADSDFASKMKNRQMGSSGGMNMTKSTSISGDMCNLEKTDGSQSDTAVGTVGTDDKKRRSSIGAKMQAMVGMSRKSRSTSQLSQTGRASKCTTSVLYVCSYLSCGLSLCLCISLLFSVLML